MYDSHAIEAENIRDSIMPIFRSGKYRTRMAITDADLVAQLAEGWTYYDRVFDERDDRTGWFVVIFRKAAYAAVWDSETATYQEAQFTDNNGNNEESQIILWESLNATEAQEAYDDAVANSADMTAATPAAPDGHKLNRVRKTNTGEGSYRVERVTFIPRGTRGTASLYVPGDIDDFKVYGKNFETFKGIWSGPKMVTVNRKVSSNYDATMKDFLNESDPNPSTDETMGWLEYNERYEKYIGYQVKITTPVGDQFV